MATITKSTDLTRALDAPLLSWEPSLQGLPQELIHYILLCLDVKDTVACGLVNKSIRQMTCNENLWRALLDRDFKVPKGNLKFSEAYEVQSNLLNNIFVSYPFQRYMQGATAITTADGKVIVGCNDRTIKVWDTTSGKCLYVFRGHLTSIIALAVCQGILFSASNDYTIIPKSTIRSWDLKTGASLNTSSETGRINFLIVADGELFSGSTHIGLSTSYWQIKSRDLKTGVCLNTIMTHPGFLFENVAAIANGKLFATCGDSTTLNDCTIKSWDLKTNEPKTTFKGHQGAISKLIVVANKFLVSASRHDTMIVFWHLKTGLSLNSHNQIEPASLAASDKLLFSGTSIGSILAWNWDGSHRGTITTNSAAITALDFADGKLFSTSLAGTCMVYDFRPTTRALLAETLDLFKSNEVEKALLVFDKLPNEVKNNIYNSLCLTLKPSEQNHFKFEETDLFDNETFSSKNKIKAIEHYIKSKYPNEPYSENRCYFEEIKEDCPLPGSLALAGGIYQTVELAYESLKDRARRLS